MVAGSGAAPCLIGRMTFYVKTNKPIDEKLGESNEVVAQRKAFP
jgi:hypothetical protein